MIDLRTFERIDLPDSFAQPHALLLPSGETVSIRLLTVGDQIQIEKRKASDAYMFTWACSIVSDDDVIGRMAKLNKMNVRDIATIRSWHEQRFHGPDMSVKFQCPRCGEEEEVDVPFRLNFFFPDGQTLTDTFGT